MTRSLPTSNPAPEAADTADQSGTAAHTDAAPALPRCIPSRELLGKDTTLAIVHEGVVYHLRTTRLGKLILTK